MSHTNQIINKFWELCQINTLQQYFQDRILDHFHRFRNLALGKISSFQNAPVYMVPFELWLHKIEHPCKWTVANSSSELFNRRFLKKDFTYAFTSIWMSESPLSLVCYLLSSWWIMLWMKHWGKLLWPI